MIGIESSGNWDKTRKWLEKMLNGDIFNQLEHHGQAGVEALRSATPVDSGLTSESWFYEIKKDGQSYSIIWGNTHTVSGVQIAVILQLGHGTGTGGYVSGRDYINPALRPIFDQIAEEAWKAVTEA